MTAGQHPTIPVAALRLKVSVRRVCELISDGILAAYVVPATGLLLVDRADCAELSWPPQDSP